MPFVAVKKIINQKISGGEDANTSIHDSMMKTTLFSFKKNKIIFNIGNSSGNLLYVYWL